MTVLTWAFWAGLACLIYAAAFSLWASMRWPAGGRKVRIGGTRVHVMEQGAGETVLALHGASANARELFGPLAPLLSPDYRLLCMDRPGHGHSARPAGAHQLHQQAALAAGVIEDAGGGPAIVVAHSLGAATALRLALDRPDLVRGLVLVSPASHPYPGGNAWHAHLAAAPVLGWLFCTTLVPLVGPLMAGAAVRNVFAPAAAPADYARETGLMLLFRPHTFRANACDVIATKAEFAAQAPLYGEIFAPAIIITADKDRVVSPKIHAVPLAADLSAAEMVTTPGAGHMPHRLRPDVVAAAVARIAAMAPSARAP